MLSFKKVLPILLIIGLTLLTLSTNAECGCAKKKRLEEEARQKREAGEHAHSHSHAHSHGGDHGHVHSHDHEAAAKNHAAGLDEFGNPWVEAKAPKRERTLEETINLWWTAMGSTVLISAAPFLILFFIPLDGGEKHKPFLNVLLAFAMGGLLGDAFLHLIPHSLPPPGEGDHGHSHHAHAHSHGEGHGHAHNDDVINCNLWVLAGMLTFLFIEKLARVMNVGHTHSHDEEGSDAEEENKNKNEESKEDKSKNLRKRKNAKNSDAGSGSDSESEETKKLVKNKEPEDTTEGFLPKMSISGYLNLAADFSHNFTDGLAIGASYLAGNTVGMITTATILIHEIPHEIGDFAILINSGCPRFKAIILQSTTAIGAMIGTALGLMMENFGQGAISAILPFTAGGFIYIACCTIMPELLASKYNSAKQVFMEVFMLVLGIVLMVIIGWFE